MICINCAKQKTGNHLRTVLNSTLTLLVLIFIYGSLVSSLKLWVPLPLLLLLPFLRLITDCSLTFNTLDASILFMCYFSSSSSILISSCSYFCFILFLSTNWFISNVLESFVSFTRLYRYRSIFILCCFSCSFIFFRFSAFSSMSSDFISLYLLSF